MIHLIENKREYVDGGQNVNEMVDNASANRK